MENAIISELASALVPLLSDINLYFLFVLVAFLVGMVKYALRDFLCGLTESERNVYFRGMALGTTFLLTPLVLGFSENWIVLGLVLGIVHPFVYKIVFEKITSKYPTVAKYLKPHKCKVK